MNSFRDLTVWQRAMELATVSFMLAEMLPQSRARALGDQIKRSASSVPANIAEGNGRQRLGDYLRFLSIANGSLMELQSHVELACRLGLLVEEDVARSRALAAEVSRMIRGLVKALERRRR